MRLDLVVGLVLMASLSIYTLLGGADYGGGVWDLLAFGPRASQQREANSSANTPVWETNHVWLILVIVLLFSAFPPAFAAISTALYIPLFIVMLGIICRGASFTFRSFDIGKPHVQRYWGLLFSAASVVTPIFLGIIVGAISNGRVVVIGGVSRNGYVRPWLAPFPIIVGVFALALFAYLAATYLAVEALSVELQEDFRKRALAAGSTAAICALATFVLSNQEGPLVRAGLLLGTRSLVEQLLTASISILAFWALCTRRYQLARVAVAAQVCSILWGWALAQYPHLVQPALTISNSASPPEVLRDLLLACSAGGIILFPSLLYLFRVFKIAPSPRSHEH
jgi:cytochrome d ubiquinol oxidase subunit II